MLLVFIIIGSVMFALLGNYVASEKEETFLKYAEKINEISEVFFHRDYDTRMVNMYLKSIGDNSDSVVFIFDTNGKIVASSNNLVSKNVSGLKKEQYYDIVSGKTTKRIGNLGGTFNVPVISVGVPLTYNNAIIGGVIFASQIPDMYVMRKEIISLFLIASLFAFFAAFILIYLTSRNVSRSIKDISDSAKALSRGDFSQRAKIRTSDEMGELAISFNHMADSIEKFDSARRDFIANASHELRTPITTISGFVEGILDGTITEQDYEKYLGIVLSESKRMARLVDDLLSVSKIEDAPFHIDYDVFDINEMIRISLISCEKKIDLKSLSVEVDFFGETCLVRGKKDYIQRVITNLLDNAVKYSYECGTISFKTYEEKHKIYVSVENTGEGIPENDLKHLWDRFYKADKSRGTDKDGVGLGLYIVKTILNKHGQDIVCESVLGETTKFTFSLEKA